MCFSIIIFFFNDTATTEIYTLSLHDALPIRQPAPAAVDHRHAAGPRERHRQAVGHEHEWRQAGPCGGMAVSLRQARSRVRVRRRLGRRIVPGHLGSVYLPADQDEL